LIDGWIDIHLIKYVLRSKKYFATRETIDDYVSYWLGKKIKILHTYFKNANFYADANVKNLLIYVHNINNCVWKLWKITYFTISILAHYKKDQERFSANFYKLYAILVDSQ
jgi:hypothetical protein